MFILLFAISDESLKKAHKKSAKTNPQKFKYKYEHIISYCVKVIIYNYKLSFIESVISSWYNIEPTVKKH